MQIVDQQIMKTKEIFEALETAKGKIPEQMEKLKEALLMDMVAEACAEKGQSLEDVNFTQDEVEDYLTDNYEEGELEEILQRVCRDVMVEFFSKLLKDKSEEVKGKVNMLLTEHFA